jgi:sugar lactone lactonase YvrE
VATDSDGNLYVGNYGAGRISVYQSDGFPLREFWLDAPGDMEVLADGRILAKHGGGPELYFIDQDSEAVTAAIDPEVVDAAFNDGWFLAASANGNTIYLSDTNAGLIRKFVNGVFSADIGAAQLDHPQDVELDANGNLVVVDDYNDSVHWFEPDGDYIGGYDGGEDLTPNAGELRGPMGLAISADGTVLVSDRERDRVLRFNGTTRAFLSEWGRSGYGDGLSNNMPDPLGAEAHFWSMSGIAPVAGGKVLICDDFNCRTGIYDSASGNLVLGVMDYMAPEGEFVLPQSIGVRESDGAYAVLDGASYCVTLMDRKNKVLDCNYLETGVDGDVLTGRIDHTPGGICWAGSKLFVTHDWTKLTEFSEDFNTYRVLAVDWGDDPGQFKGNNGMCSEGNTLYVSDRDNDRVQVFVNGTYSRSIAMPNPGSNNIEEIALDKSRRWLFVLDNPWNDGSKILRFNVDTGEYLDALEFGFGVGGILACDPAGYVYVYYWGSEGLLHKYDPPPGANQPWPYMCGLAPYGDGDGNVRNVQSLTISPDGRYLIGDRDRRQVVILTP